MRTGAATKEMVDVEGEAEETVVEETEITAADSEKARAFLAGSGYLRAGGSSVAEIVMVDFLAAPDFPADSLAFHPAADNLAEEVVMAPDFLADLDSRMGRWVGLGQVSRHQEMMGLRFRMVLGVV